MITSSASGGRAVSTPLAPAASVRQGIHWAPSCHYCSRYRSARRVLPTVMLSLKVPFRQSRGAEPKPLHRDLPNLDRARVQIRAQARA